MNVDVLPWAETNPNVNPIVILWSMLDKKIECHTHLFSHGTRETSSTRTGRYGQRAVSQFDYLDACEGHFEKVDEKSTSFIS